MNKKFLSLTGAAMMILSCGLTSCGTEKDDGETAKFTVLIDKAEDTIYYSSYDDNPVVKFMESISEEKCGKKLDFTFKSLTSGSEKDQFNTMIATGEYYDIMALSYSNYSSGSLCEDGVLKDLTELVDKYMPNYKHLIETDSELGNLAYSYVNGEKKICSLFQVYDQAQPNFEGTYYRRDWIVKYGTNPNTGAKFTSSDGNDVNNTYTDDVIFPSWYDAKLKTNYLAIDSTWDGTYPVYISDWEWMFEIFEKAIKAEVPAADQAKAYCYSIPYTGLAEMFSGFGGGSSEWARDENGDAIFNGTTENMKSYLECLQNWYSKGWIDTEFDQRPSDMFYAINTSAVHSGYVGCWTGRRAEFGAELRDKENFPCTEGFLAKGAPLPINDKYGDASTQMKAPNASYRFSTVGGAWGISNDVSDEDAAALLTFLDYMYSDEGGEILMAIDPQNPDPADNRILKDEFYTKFNMPNGVYTKEVKADNSVIYHKTAEAAADTYLYNASLLNRFGIAYTKIKEIDWGTTVLETEAYTLWDKYTNEGYIPHTYPNLMSSEESNTYSKVKNNVETYMYQQIPKFIKGTQSIENDFATYSTTLTKYAPSKVTKIFQRIFDGEAPAA